MSYSDKPILNYPLEYIRHMVKPRLLVGGSPRWAILSTHISRYKDYNPTNAFRWQWEVKPRRRYYYVVRERT
jgi:hypothetical protein